VTKEYLGAFIDAIYAIAATILALEIPGNLDGQFSLQHFAGMLLEYATSFIILFAIWLQHRRINTLIDNCGQIELWLNGVILLLVCLIPRATTLVFSYGGDVTLMEIEDSLLHGTGWSVSKLVDIFYIGTVMAADLALLSLTMMVTRTKSDTETIAVRRSKLTTSSLVVIVLASSLLTPIQNRVFLLLIPVALIFERHWSNLMFRSRNQRG